MADTEADERAAQAARARRQLKKHQQLKKKAQAHDLTHANFEVSTSSAVDKDVSPKHDSGSTIIDAEAVKSDRISPLTSVPDVNAASLQDTINTLVSEKSALTERLSDLEAKLEESEISSEADRTRLKKVAGLQSRIEELEVAVEKGKEEIAQVQTVKSKVEDRMKQLTKELDEVQSERRSLKDSLSSKQSEVAVLAAKASDDSATKTLQKTVEEAEQRIGILEGELGRRSKALAAAEREKDEHKGLLAATERERDAQAQRLTILEKKISEAAETKGQSDVRLKEAQKSVDDLIVERDTITTLATSLRNEVEGLKNSVKNADESLASAKESASSANKRATASSSRVNELQTENERVVSTLNDVNARVGGLTEEKASLLDQLDGLKAQLKREQSQNEASSTEQQTRFKAAVDKNEALQVEASLAKEEAEAKIRQLESSHLDAIERAASEVGQKADLVRRLEEELESASSKAHRRELELLDQIRVHTTSLSTLEESFKDQETALQTALSEASKDRENYMSVKRQHEEVAQKLQEGSKAQEALKIDSTDLQRRSDTAESSLKAAEESRAEESKKLAEVEQKYTRASEDLAAATRQLEELGNRLTAAQNMREDLDKTQSELESSRRELKAAKDEGEGLQAEVLRLEEELAKGEEDGQDKLSLARKESSQLRKDVAKMKTEAIKTQGELDAVKKEVQKSGAKATKAEADLRKKLADAQSALAQLEKKTTAQDREVDDARKDRDVALQEVASLQTAGNKSLELEASISSLEERLASTNAELESVRSDLDEALKRAELAESVDKSGPSRSSSPLLTPGSALTPSGPSGKTSFSAAEMDSIQLQHELEVSQLRSQVRKLEAALFEEGEKAHKSKRKIAEIEEELSRMSRRGQSSGGIIPPAVTPTPVRSQAATASNASAAAPGSRAHRRSATAARIPSLTPLSEAVTSDTDVGRGATRSGPAASTSASTSPDRSRDQSMIPTSQRHRRKESLQLLGKRIAADLSIPAGNPEVSGGQAPQSQRPVPVRPTSGGPGVDAQQGRHSRKHSNPLDSENLLGVDGQDVSLRRAGTRKTAQLLADGGLLFCAHCTGEELLVV